MKQPSADVSEDSSRTHHQRDTPFHHGVQRSPLKKPHIDTSSGLGVECVEGAEGALKPVPKGASLRSVSLPAHHGTKVQNGTDTSRLDNKQSGRCLEENTTQTTPTRKPPQFPEMVQNLPKYFDFTSQFSQQLSSSSVEEEFHTPEGEFVGVASGKVTSPEGGDVFLFSSSPSGTVQRKRRDARVGPSIPLLVEAGLLDQGAGPVGGASETASMEVALLTQQLELGSDNVSSRKT